MELHLLRHLRTSLVQRRLFRTFRVASIARNVAVCCLVCCLPLESGVEWSGVEWSGVEWSGVEWSGVEWSGVEWSGVEWND
jgi:hypothetical protein